MKCKAISIFVFMTVLTGCSFMTLTKEGEKISLVNIEPARNCKYLGEISVYTREAPNGNFMNAEDNAVKDRNIVVKNKAAKMGGSHAVLLSHMSEIRMWFDVYSVYRC